MIREAIKEDALAISEVRIASWRTTYAGIVDPDFLEGMTPEKWAEAWAKGNKKEDSFTYVAREAGSVIGFVIGGLERDKKYPDYPFEIYAIYLLQEHQGKGIGTKLIKRMADSLSGLGVGGVLIWALDENPCSSFYKKLGGQPIDHQSFKIKGRTHPETAYGWKSLKDFRLD
ncbi:GNAT family N-acetyltransferase [Jeotgalibacillus proteolyticus]|uniref:GNAT family N-acetyltransferase n=1 Tax=Jeotgalibacillus proteolyticus TaxID=2082395 RepID=A0A2S5GCX4_9BACL|nr:GNAT family N-acetyltransferase [Jeotgalibacillus proteolyticus]PPA70765.1 GNAT family N-acetyltransferase [Jeotgalibacillus proteolyticus]